MNVNISEPLGDAIIAVALSVSKIKLRVDRRKGNGEFTAKKIERIGRVGFLTGVRQERLYMAIKYIHERKGYPIERLCKKANLNRSSYYKWLKRKPSNSEVENTQISEWIKELYEEQNGILGYRQMTITLNRVHKTKYNIKCIRRLMRILNLQSVCRKKRYNFIRSTPEVTAENILNREFYADAPNEKWLTDVTEFKYYVGTEIKKLYLSAILDLYDRRIVAYKIGDSNNNKLVFDNFDKAVELNPDAHPLFHSDRGFQYTNKTFHAKLEQALSIKAWLYDTDGIPHRFCGVKNSTLLRSRVEFN